MGYEAAQAVIPALVSILTMTANVPIVVVTARSRRFDSDTLTQTLCRTFRVTHSKNRASEFCLITVGDTGGKRFSRQTA